MLLWKGLILFNGLDKHAWKFDNGNLVISLGHLNYRHGWILYEARGDCAPPDFLADLVPIL